MTQTSPSSTRKLPPLAEGMAWHSIDAVVQGHLTTFVVSAASAEDAGRALENHFIAAGKTVKNDETAKEKNAAELTKPFVERTAFFGPNMTPKEKIGIVEMMFETLVTGQAREVTPEQAAALMRETYFGGAVSGPTEKPHLTRAPHRSPSRGKDASAEAAYRFG